MQFTSIVGIIQVKLMRITISVVASALPGDRTVCTDRVLTGGYSSM